MSMRKEGTNWLANLGIKVDEKTENVQDDKKVILHGINGICLQDIAIKTKKARRSRAINSVENETKKAPDRIYEEDKESMAHRDGDIPLVQETIKLLIEVSFKEAKVVRLADTRNVAVTTEVRLIRLLITNGMVGAMDCMVNVLLIL